MAEIDSAVKIPALTDQITFVLEGHDHVDLGKRYNLDTMQFRPPQAKKYRVYPIKTIFFLTKTQLLERFPKWNPQNFTLLAYLQKCLYTFLDPPVNLNPHFWTFHDNWLKNKI